MFGQYVGCELAPDMVAAEMLFLFDQDDFQLGPHPRHGKRDEATGKSAADYRQIAFDVFYRGGCHVRRTSRTVP